MKKLLVSLGLAAMVSAPMAASANWFNGPWNNNGWNNGWNNGYYNNYNGWPEWTPMYWAQEMANCMDNDGYGCFDNDNYYNPHYGYAPNGYYAPRNYPMPAPNWGYAPYPMPPQSTAPVVPAAPAAPTAE